LLKRIFAWMDFKKEEEGRRKKKERKKERIFDQKKSK
jgi:hypothetical protein